MIYEINIRLAHYGDWTQLTVKYDVKAEVVFSQVNPHTYATFNIIRIRCSRSNECEGFMNELRKIKRIMKILYKREISPRYYELSYIDEYNSSAKKIILEHGGFIKGSIANEGDELYTIYFLGKPDYNSLGDSLKKIGKVKEIKINEGKNSLTEMLSINLSEIEREILEFAYFNGFFDYPRKLTLDDISREFNITKTTVNFHLRNAIKKILSSLVKERFY